MSIPDLTVKCLTSGIFFSPYSSCISMIDVCNLEGAADLVILDNIFHFPWRQ